MKDYIRLIISDLHIGSAYSKEEEILELLKNINFDELILAGDIIDFIKVPQFTLESSKIIEYLSKLDKKIIYIIGNHDSNLSSLKNISIGNFEFKDKYDFDYFEKKYRVVHGHQYDHKFIKWHYLMIMISVIHDWMERFIKLNITSIFSKFLIRVRKLRSIWDVIKWNSDVDVIIMGHTHEPEVLIWVNKYGKIKTYANCGDWIDNQTYIIIKDKELRLKKYEK